MRLPPDVSAEGHRIDSLLRFTHVAALVLAGIAVLWLAIVLVRDRRSKTPRYASTTTWRDRAVPLGFAALVFFVVDGYLFWRSHTDLREHVLNVDAALEEEGVVRLQIAGRQWAWDVRYPGADDLFDTDDDILLVNRVVIPKGAAVVYELSALDVVHAFALPELRVKQDAIPGAVSRGWFRAAKAGRFTIACAQYCGVHHYLMSGTIEVLSPEAFAAWQEASSGDALRMRAEDARAVKDEATRAPVVEGEGEAALAIEAPRRDWAWPWGAPGFVPKATAAVEVRP